MTDTATLEKTNEEKESARKARAASMLEKEKELNKDKTGKGLRTFVGMTRGRNPQEIQYEAFDDSKPETLPGTLSEFMDLTGTKDEKVIVSYLIDGFNSSSYTAASDPVAEFVEPTWDEETKKQFRLVIRNYAAATNLSIEDAVAVIKPGMVAALDKAKAAKG